MAEVEIKKPSRTKRQRRETPPAKPRAAEPVPPATPTPAVNPGLSLGVGLAALVIGIFAYWPSIRLLLDAWDREPDYSHGYLVAPLTLFLLWLRGAGPEWLTPWIAKLPLIGWMASWRKNTFPGFGPPGLWLGGFLLMLAVVMRMASAWYFIETIDEWSLVVWVAAVIALLFGSRVFWWSLPAIAFLFFMIPLPFGAEQSLSLQLQSVATKLSTWALQLLGQPALAEGHTIRLGDHQLEVAQACSGLRLFVSILAVAYFYLVVARCQWWERIVLVVSALPIAVATNAARIVVTGLLYQFASTEAAHKFAHDMAGFAMIPVAAAVFGLLLWYLTMLFPWEEELDVSAVVHRANA